MQHVDPSAAGREILLGCFEPPQEAFQTRSYLKEAVTWAHLDIKEDCSNVAIRFLGPLVMLVIAAVSSLFDAIGFILHAPVHFIATWVNEGGAQALERLQQSGMNIFQSFYLALILPFVGIGALFAPETVTECVDFPLRIPLPSQERGVCGREGDDQNLRMAQLYQEIENLQRALERRPAVQQAVQDSSGDLQVEVLQLREQVGRLAARAVSAEAERNEANQVARNYQDQVYAGGAQIDRLKDKHQKALEAREQEIQRIKQECVDECEGIVQEVERLSSTLKPLQDRYEKIKMLLINQYLGDERGSRQVKNKIATIEQEHPIAGE